MDTMVMEMRKHPTNLASPSPRRPCEWRPSTTVSPGIKLTVYAVTGEKLISDSGTGGMGSSSVSKGSSRGRFFKSTEASMLTSALTSFLPWRAAAVRYRALLEWFPCYVALGCVMIGRAWKILGCRGFGLHPAGLASASLSRSATGLPHIITK